MSSPSTFRFPDTGIRLVSPIGLELTFIKAAIHVRAQGGLAVIALTQHFYNPYTNPLSVRYTMPLPADAAVRAYSFLIGGRLIRGEIDRRERAQERYNKAIRSGYSAGHLQQNRSNIFEHEFGNIPPREGLISILELDQKLEWTEEGRWCWRFPTLVGPRYLDADEQQADELLLDTVDPVLGRREKSPKIELYLHLHDPLTGEPSSPTHAISVAQSEITEIQLKEASLLNRDIVVDWPVRRPQIGLSLQVARPEESKPMSHHSFGLLTITPPSSVAELEGRSRDLIFLLDASGSMEGEPFQQAKSLIQGVIQTLNETDRMELIAFNNNPFRWKQEAVYATEAEKEEAYHWLELQEVDGGTEMRDGILEALRPLRDNSQRQVILVTDGLIQFEKEIVETLYDHLPRGCRLHTVGVGSVINRFLTKIAARVGRGTEVILDPGGSVDQALKRLLLRISPPLITDLELSGSAFRDHEPTKVPDLFGASPVLLSVRLKSTGGMLQVRGDTIVGPWSAEIQVPAQEAGAGQPSIVALYGRERIEDLESLFLANRSPTLVDQQIEQTGLDFQIATRRTSWIAISDQPTVDPEVKRREEVILHELPHGVDVRAPRAGGGVKEGAYADFIALLRDDLREIGGFLCQQSESESSEEEPSYAEMPPQFLTISNEDQEEVPETSPEEAGPPIEVKIEPTIVNHEHDTVGSFAIVGIDSTIANVKTSNHRWPSWVWWTVLLVLVLAGVIWLSSTR